MSILTNLKGAERQKKAQARTDLANAKYQTQMDLKVFAACRKMMRQEIPQLNGRKVNGETIMVKHINRGWKITTTGYGYDPERTLELTLDVFTGSFRPADDCPEQDYRSVGIRIKWWRRGQGCTSEEMSDSVTIETGALDWDKEIQKKRKEFRDSLTNHIKRCVGLND